MDSQIKTSAEAYESDALPRAREVHADPNHEGCTDVALPVQMKKPVKTKSPAQWAYERIILYIKNFEEQLDNQHEIAMGFAGSNTGILKIEGMGYFDPDIVTFFGSDETGAKTQLVQHVSQLNVMLRALPKETDQPEPVRIGFRLAQELNGDA
ncbi:DUF6173 family protein [Pseudaestuariivita rosea]|uniref:DUF6173 family protein n=1 Tax=Pseudaestuariivita rosea TaxID=2763263 RepID=UPI001ABA429D|nr:DUF6173 family protein [Pseudaestuariivita rosea]